MKTPIDKPLKEKLLKCLTAGYIDTEDKELIRLFESIFDKAMINSAVFIDDCDSKIE